MQNSQTLFNAFINDIKINQIHHKAFKKVYNDLQINLKELGKMSIPQVINIRTVLLKKISTEADLALKIEQEWIQSEKKMYNWLFFCYLELKKKQFADITEEDYAFLSALTTLKCTRLIKFQTLHIFKQPNRPKWTEEQDNILYNLLEREKKYEAQGEWSVIARELFMRGNQQTIKLGKHCRQRWLNHLHPSLNKQQWANEQDIKLMEFIRDEGKKWSCLVKYFKNAKSQHMIKNRFYSLLRKIKKKNRIKEQIEQRQLIDMTIQHLNDLCKKKIIQTTIIMAQKKEVSKFPNIQQYNFTMECPNPVEEVKESKFKMKLLTSMSLERLQDVKPQKGDLQIFTNSHAIIEPFNINCKQFDNLVKNELTVPNPLQMSSSVPYNTTPFSSSPAPPTPTNELFSLNFIRQQNFPQRFSFNLYDFVKDNK